MKTLSVGNDYSIYFFDRYCLWKSKINVAQEFGF